MKKVYILSGLGVDKRVFNNFNLPFLKETFLNPSTQLYITILFIQTLILN